MRDTPVDMADAKSGFVNHFSKGFCEEQAKLPSSFLAIPAVLTRTPTCTSLVLTRPPIFSKAPIASASSSCSYPTAKILGAFTAHNALRPPSYPPDNGRK